jgi:hypothetical protein
MAQSAILSLPATIRSRKVASSLLGAAAALLLLAAGGVLFDLRQEMVNQREYAQRAEKLDFRVVDFLAGARLSRGAADRE